jgi:hypothetical protein
MTKQPVDREMIEHRVEGFDALTAPRSLEKRAEGAHVLEVPSDGG